MKDYSEYKETLAYYIANPLPEHPLKVWGYGRNPHNLNNDYIWCIEVGHAGVRSRIWDNRVPKYYIDTMECLMARNLLPTPVEDIFNERFPRGTRPEEVMPLIGILPWESKDSAK